MNAPYAVRLICGSLAAFFVVHCIVGCLVRAFTGRLLRTAETVQPRAAERLLFAVRMLPTALGLFVVAALCIPSYLWLEPVEIAEAITPACLIAAGAALALSVAAAAGGLRVTVRSRRSIRLLRRTARAAHLECSVPAWVVNSPEPFLAIAGIVRPCLLVSRPLLDTLAPGQLAVALRHEDAHRVSGDNLKRLLIALAPPLLPGIHGFRGLEQAWRRFAEYAADDDAVSGDTARAVSLAEALLRVARAGSTRVALAATFAGDPADLERRIDRLLRPSLIPARDPQPLAISAAAAITVVASLAALALRPASLQSAHDLLEHLIH